jgi:hypothetical protein
MNRAEDTGSTASGAVGVPPVTASPNGGQTPPALFHVTLAALQAQSGNLSITVTACHTLTWIQQAGIIDLKYVLAAAEYADDAKRVHPSLAEVGNSITGNTCQLLSCMCT